MDDGYTRHTLALIFDVPDELAAREVLMGEILNAAISRVTELLDADPRFAGLLRRHKIDFGWEAGSWEKS